MSDKTIGSVTLSASSKLVFDIGEWRGKSFAKVRKFITTQKYQGPTRSGISLNKIMLKKIISTLVPLEKTIPPQEENQFKTISKSDTEYIRIATLPDEESDNLPFVDIREYIDTPKYQGPTKRGMRFRWNLLPDVIICLREQDKVIIENEDKQPSLFGAGAFECEEELQKEEDKSAEALSFELLGEDLKKFPEDFLNGSIDKGSRLELPEEPLQLEQDSAGTYTLKTVLGVFTKVRNPVEANFIIYAQLCGHKEITVPQEMIRIFKTVKSYENYVRNLRSKIVAKILRKSRQDSIANYEADKLLRELGMPKLDEL
ncbi:MAG: hypothetical protein ABIN18_13485 [Pseudomonadota bacterium]